MTETSPIQAAAAPADWIDPALRPASIAIIGASDNPEKIGGRPIKYMLQHGFQGRLYPVNPSRSVIQGIKAWEHIDALPEQVDMAVVCVPGDAAVSAVQACARNGVKVCVVIASGFAETGQAGRDAQEKMLAAARLTGMRIVGPNSQGLANFSCGAIASFATLIGETTPADGPVAIVSQSGAMSMVPYALLRNEGIGVRHSYATGNESDLTVADFALAVAQDPEVRLILLYMEAVPDPLMLARAAAEAARRNIPILVLKAGVSARGQSAAQSHTGALATEDKVLDAWFRQNGMLRVHDMRSLVSGARLLLRGGTIGGRRITAISNSGAACVMAADAADRHGLELPLLPAATRQAIDAVLPAFANSANPIDLTAALLGNSHIFGQVLPLVAEAEAADGFFISLPMTGKGYDVAQFADDAASFARKTGKPTVVSSPLAATRQCFEQAGIVAFEHDEDAMAALGQLASSHALRTEAMRLRQLPMAHGHVPDTTQEPGGGFLSEARSLECLEALGIPTAPWKLCRSHEEMRSALATLAGPWVIKACSPDIPHKSEYGLVKLGIADAGEALEQLDRLAHETRSLDKRFDGVIVASMVRVQRECMVGARWDPHFGVIVVVGDGGKYVEAMPDVATLVYPFDAEHAESRLRSLRIAALFDGVRGEPAMPVRAIAQTAVALGHWLHQQQGRIASVDINPLMIVPGGNICAADALVERRDA